MKLVTLLPGDKDPDAAIAATVHGTGISPDDYNALVDERDALAAALRELTKPKYGVATMVAAHKALGVDFEIPTVEESDDDLDLRY